MKKLIVMSGIPGSGKSTYARDLVQKECSAIILSTDNIRKILTGDESNLTKDDLVWRRIYASLGSKHHTADIIIVDATNITFKRRTSYLKFKPLFDKVELIIVDTPIDKAIERNEKRDRVVPASVIQNMYDSLLKNQNYRELMDAGFDEIHMVR